MKKLIALTLLFLSIAFPAFAISASEVTAPVKPILERVIKCTNIPDSYQAIWGYLNDFPEAVEIPVGTAPKSINKFDGASSQDLGQATSFLSGRQVATFRTSIALGQTLVWTLGTSDSTRTATATIPPTPRERECIVQ